MAPFSQRVSTRPEIVAFLSVCIQTCTDGEKGFALAAADVRAPSLKAYFQGKFQERADFVLALQESVDAQGRFAENEGSTGGALHRGLVEARKVVEGSSDELVLQECLRGELAALEAYDAARARTPLDSLPPALRAQYTRQRKSIEGTVEYLRRRLRADAESRARPISRS